MPRVTVEGPWWLIILVLLWAIPWVIYRYGRDRERRQELATWASHNGFPFRPQRDNTFADAYPNFRCLWQGRHRWAFHIAEGPWKGFAVTAFD